MNGGSGSVLQGMFHVKHPLQHRLTRLDGAHAIKPFFLSE
jgi:hypothetical protein